MHILLHGRGSGPERGVFPWLKEKLESEVQSVIVPQLPKKRFPRKSIWDRSIEDQIHRLSDNEEYYMTHSLSFHSVARLLEKGVGNPKGIYALAPFQTLNYGEVFKLAYKMVVNSPDHSNLLAPFAAIGAVANSVSWCTKELPWGALAKYQDKMHLFFSLNDKLVDPESQIELFQKKLPDAHYIIEPNAGHFSTSDGFRKYDKLWDIMKADIKNK